MMQSVRKNCSILFLIAILASFGIPQIARSTVPLVDEIQSGFIDNVLPFDVSKYNVTSQYNPSDTGITDKVQYTLQSSDSNITVRCYIHNNALSGCLVTVQGPAIRDREYANLNDAAIGFLEKYQIYSKRDLSSMINMLSGVDTSKNLTTLSGNINFTLNSFSVGDVKQTTFCFTDIFNRAPYTFLMFSFKDGYFSSHSDTTVRYTIGDTTVNISEDQAIDIAMKYIQTYSYDMPGGWKVSGFNVTRTAAKLNSIATDSKSTVLEPYWDVSLYLNQTYPGSVHGLEVRVWAGSGKVFLCGHIAYLVPENPEVPLFSENTTLNATSETISQPDMLVAVAILITIIAVIVISIVAPIVIIKKKRKEHSLNF